MKPKYSARVLGLLIMSILATLGWPQSPCWWKSVGAQMLASGSLQTLDGRPAGKALALPLKMEMMSLRVDYPYHYYAQLQLGKPPIPFKVVLDVQLDESFVPKFSHNQKSPINFRRGYLGDRTNTSQANVDAKFAYHGVELRAKRHYDSARLPMARWQDASQQYEDGSDAPSEVASFELDFLAVYDDSKGSMANMTRRPVDGSLALYRFEANSTTNDTTGSNAKRSHLVRALKSQGLVDSELFGLWFCKHSSSVASMFGQQRPSGCQTDMSGELVVGAVNASRYAPGSLKFHDSQQPNESASSGWMLALDQVSVNSSAMSIRRSNCTVKLATHSNYVYGPQLDVYRIYLSAEVDLVEREVGVYPCKRLRSLPTLQFRFGGQDYELPPDSYVKPIDASRYGQDFCYLTMLPSRKGVDSGDCEWTLGTDFLMNYYTVFDPQRRRVGFASLNEPSARNRWVPLSSSPFGGFDSF